MDFIERVTGMFTKPEETIKDILKEPRTEEPLVIIGIYGIIAVLSAIASYIHSGGSLPILSAVFTLILAFVGWAIATGVVHVLALFLGGQGKYNPDMLNAIGYTYIVKYIPAIISLVLVFFTPVIAMPATPQITDASQVKEAMQPYIALLEQSLFNPVAILSMVISYLGLIWSCYLGTIAVKNGEKVSKITSYIAVFVPMAIYIIFSLLASYGSYFLLKMLYG